MPGMSLERLQVGRGQGRASCREQSCVRQRGPVVRMGVQVLEQPRVHRRHAHEDRRPVVPHVGHHRFGRESGVHPHRHARQQRAVDPDAQPVHVKQRQLQAEHVSLGPAPQTRERFDALDHRGMAERRALAAPRGARGVDQHRGRVVGQRLDVGGARGRCREVALGERVLGQRVLQARVAQQQPRRRVLQDVAHLPRTVAGVDRHPHGTHRVRTQHRRNQVRTGGRQHGHPIATLDAAGSQGRGPGPHRRIEVAPGPGLLAVHQRDAVASGGQRLQESGSGGGHERRVANKLRNSSLTSTKMFVLT